MTDGDWQAALDAFEQRLAAQEASYEQGLVSPVPPFEPPKVTTPLPQGFVARATELVWRCRALEETLAGALQHAQEQLDRVGAAATAPAAPAQPIFFDSRV